ncbi:MAG TPA: ABC transporter permease [Patescibacteria group bacterium]|nr:ABC transporter permease [Gammaproteobacteria bacterium]HWA51463.1 ABC transporter permease [Patescibacteria group bacterium]
MHFQLALLWTDILIYILALACMLFGIFAWRNPLLRESWRIVLQRPLAMVALVVLIAYSLIGLLDSVHFHPALPVVSLGQVFYSSRVESLFDVLISPLGQREEQTYTAPFAIAAVHPSGYLIKALFAAVLKALVIWVLLAQFFVLCSAVGAKQKVSKQFVLMLRGKTVIAWRSIFITMALVLLVVFISLALSTIYHVMGTDKVGQDVFYQTLKSIRTGLLIGTLTTLFMLPFSIFFGTIAGYFGGWIDDAVQYIYITLSSIPGVLLITAAILSLQIFIKDHPSLFPNLAVRADARLLILCAILGVTSWTDLCRLLRGETLKLRQIDFSQAAVVMGVSHYKIILKHILPNVMHIILITVVLNFSALVLAEAVLSYVGVGVDPSTISWGNMINSARLELAREPVVWWPLCAAFIFMFMLVFCANIFADAVRDAFDPRLRGVLKRSISLRI